MRNYSLFYLTLKSYNIIITFLTIYKNPNHPLSGHYVPLRLPPLFITNIAFPRQYITASVKPLSQFITRYILYKKHMRYFIVYTKERLPLAQEGLERERNLVRVERPGEGGSPQRYDRKSSNESL